MNTFRMNTFRQDEHLQDKPLQGTSMPLPQPLKARRQVHTRTITCTAYEREDHLWDIEGHMTDHKAYAFHNDFRGQIEVGEPLHDMWLRLTLDESFTIQDVQAVTDKGPFAICPKITPAFKKMVGMKIVAGFNSRVMSVLGGVQGCTHLVDLVRPIATTAYQAMYPIMARRTSKTQEMEDVTTPVRRPRLLNTCHAFNEAEDHARRLWPEYFKSRSDGGSK